MVFKKKSGIVKGLGIRYSSSLLTTASSNSSVEYIQQLERNELGAKRSELRTKRSELGTKRHKLSKIKSKRIFLTF